MEPPGTPSGDPRCFGFARRPDTFRFQKLCDGLQSACVYIYIQYFYIKVDISLTPF